MDDLSFPPPTPPLSPTNFSWDLELDMDLTLPPPPYPSDSDISINKSLPFPTPPEFSTVNVDSVANELTLFLPNFKSSSVDDTNMFNMYLQVQKRLNGIILHPFHRLHQTLVLCLML